MRSAMIGYDFQYVKGLAEAFFTRSNIRRSLEVIADQGVTGWEVWWQVEFFRFLANHPETREWDGEWRFEYDYRREKDKGSLYPDFVLSKEGWRQETFTLVELKQDASYSSCIRRMVEDAVSVRENPEIRRVCSQLLGSWDVSENWQG